MVKLQTSKSVPLMNVALLSAKFDKKVSAKIVGFGVASFEDGDKPKMLLEIGNRRYDFALNSTNQTFLGDFLAERGLKRDTEEIKKESIVELEVYNTGSSDAYEFGIRINTLVLAK